MPFLTLVFVNIIIIMKLIEIKKRKRHLTSTKAHVPLVPISNNNNNKIENNDDNSPNGDKQTLKRNQTVKISNLDLRITFMVLTVVLAFFVFQSPYLIIRMVPDKQRGKWWQIIKVLSDFFLALNFSINFLIYCFFGQKFRTTALEYLKKLGLEKFICKK